VKIEELGLRSSTLLYLKRFGINEVNDIKDWEPEEFNKIRNIGNKRISEIFDKLNEIK